MTALDILKQHFGYDSFRGGQEPLINDIIAGKDVLGIMPTGAGKSICFQVPALITDGIAIIISPLISLMKDQVNALVQSGINAAYINSTLTGSQYYSVMENARAGKYKLIYVAPERLMNTDFLSFVQTANISILTVDEAHCISQWGQDFRPSYLKIPEFTAALKSRPAISAFTATATPKVRDDIINLLKLKEPTIIVTGFDRPNLRFEVRKPEDKFSALIEFLDSKKESNENKSGIVYCSTRAIVEEVCERLNQNGYVASRYHAGLSDSERHGNQDDFLYDRVRIMVATNAFGMGIDKSNVSFVVHYNMPKDIESYYQEAGRAGRDGEPADCILLYSGQDVRLNQWMIEKSHEAENINESGEINGSLESYEQDRRRLREMTFYCATNDCLRGYILKYFGETPPLYCYNCGNCNMKFEILDITTEAQKVLSCVFRMKERYGVNLMIGTLRGSKNKNILRLKLDKLSTYNICECSEKQLRAIIHHLLLNGYLIKTDDEYPIIKLGSRANNVLRGMETVSMKLPAEMEKTKDADIDIESNAGKDTGTGANTNVNVNAGKDAGKSTGRSRTKKEPRDRDGNVIPVNKELFEVLRKLRLNIAAKQSVPPFVIFSDSTLTDMCIKLPTMREGFLDVSGVGEVKADRYGEQFLTAISEFMAKQK